MFDSLVESMFREVDDIVWDLQTGRLGILDGDVIYSFEKTGNKSRITKNPIKELGVKVPAYAVATPIESLQPGDIVILDDGQWVFFLSSTPATDDDEVTFKGLNYDTGRQTTVTAISNLLLGSKSLLAVKNFIGSEAGNLSSMLPLLMLQDDGDGEGIGEVLGLMTLIQNQGTASKGKKAANGAFDLNSMLPLLLMKKGGKMGGKKGLLLMSLLQGGTGGGLNSLLPFLALGDD